MKEPLEIYEQTRKKIYDTYMAINKEFARYLGRIESAELLCRDGMISEEKFFEIKHKYQEIMHPLEECERVVKKYGEYVDYKMGQDYPEYKNPLDDFFEAERLTEEEYETLKKAFELETRLVFESVSDGDRK